MARPVQILCIDDEPSVLKSYQRVFRDSNSYHVVTLEDATKYDFREALKFDVIICDQRMPGILGSDIFKALCELGFQGKKIICSGYADFNDIMWAFNGKHIDHFLNKPWINEELKKLTEIRHQPKPFQSFSSSQEMDRVYQLAHKAADALIPVYIQGETGTGKEVITRYIHEHSTRAKNAFITVNCATLTTDLFESLMFGHKKGAFTGAHNDHVGFYQAAHGGTLFLDEVVEIPLPAQAKILRALQENTITRVGETHNIPVDVRIISASATSMEKAVSAGLFREDLMYRLNVYPITIPPLRARKKEIEILFKHFLEKFNFQSQWNAILYDESVRKWLLNYPWPGNIRELENLCHYLCATLDEPLVKLKNLPQHVLKLQEPDNKSQFHSIKPNTEHAILTVEEALQQCKQNKSQAAKLLGISRMTLWRHLNK
ncbi:MAG: sigma-54 dependent transcriptional regulator [Gammaproteobacteria bacterium]|nr:sigma-54 dependent transcriptional regulator [Gammaproteobacteria bacterium]